MHWHFYSTVENEPNGKMPVLPEGIAAYVFASPQPNTRPLYRFYKAQGSGIHFYTLDPQGEAAPALGYRFDQIQCHVPDGPGAGIIPIHRFWNQESGDHFFTADPSGELARDGGYVPEGIGFYACDRGVANTIPLYRWIVVEPGQDYAPKGGLGNQYGPQPGGAPCPLGTYWDGNTCTPAVMRYPPRKGPFNIGF